MSIEYDKEIIRHLVWEVLDKNFILKRSDIPTYELYLPNLRVQRIDISPIVDRLRIRATIENVGRARSNDCDVVAQVLLRGNNQSHQLQARCPALGPRSIYRVELGTIQGVAAGQFVDVTVIVDPPTQARPGGEVWESNEQDNILTDGIYIVPPPEGHIEEEGHLPEEPKEPEIPKPPIHGKH